MDILRAPWRMDYIRASGDNTEGGSKNEKCIFCSFAREKDDEENLILARGEAAYVVLNRYPYSSGHVMVIPYLHTSDLRTLPSGDAAEIFSLAQKAIHAIERAMGADGFNLGMNIGRIAGAGIDTHLHLHVVPRWNGDTNFMSVTAETKVLPEALKVTREKLLKAWISAEQS
ncbi:MAG: HIT domain-containing protein [Synergistaceae bacterium]|jgi:ATP adenylyltransferase|nr:HIT domain-containing protein [Synergistaceae bacterium]